LTKRRVLSLYSERGRVDLGSSTYRAILSVDVDQSTARSVYTHGVRVDFGHVDAE
jgi:hypothetical protein